MLCEHSLMSSFPQVMLAVTNPDCMPYRNLPSDPSILDLSILGFYQYYLLSNAPFMIPR